MDSFTDLYQKAVGPDTIVSYFLSGHLAVEFLLRKNIEIYDSNLTKISNDLTHAKLIALAFDIGAINEQQKSVLVSINKIRNKFVHRITYIPTISELINLYQSASKAFTDLSDGISQGLQGLSSVQEVSEIEEWWISELFVQICYDLHEVYHQNGGDIEDF